MKEPISIRWWFHNHPNITFLLLAAWYLVLMVITLGYFNDERWGWAALGLFAALFAGEDARSWWKDHL